MELSSIRRKRPVILVIAMILLFSTVGRFPIVASTSNPTLLYSGLSFPASFRFSPDGRIFFNEKNTGNIRIIESGAVLPTPFAHLSVSTDDQEQGLLGLALDPGLATNGYVYVYYTYFDGTTHHGHITRFTANANTGTNPLNIFDVTDPTPSTGNHDGGYLRFGPDGKLYVQVGEFTAQTLAQDLRFNVGKILRMNPDGTVPSDNPFPNSLAYAYGIRNGFGMDFDKETGQLVETEPGPTSDDEINIIVRGGNYGWPNCLGNCNNASYINPIATFTPVVTPTGIAYAYSRTYYFGEWNGASLQKLTLTQASTLYSISQVWTSRDPNSGVVDVELGPDQRIYFSTTSEIFSFDISAPGPPTRPFSPWMPLVIYGSIAAAFIALAVAYNSRRSKKLLEDRHSVN